MLCGTEECTPRHTVDVLIMNELETPPSPYGMMKSDPDGAGNVNVFDDKTLLRWSAVAASKSDHPLDVKNFKAEVVKREPDSSAIEGKAVNMLNSNYSVA